MLSVRAPSHTRSFSNSTSPLPILPQERVRVDEAKNTPQYKISRDLANLYEAFSCSTTNNIIYKNENMVCFCCERDITKCRENKLTAIDRNIITSEEDLLRNEEECKRKIDEFIKNNKITTSLIYGSNQVQKYMKKVMTRDNWNNILDQGFPCPHKALWKVEESNRNSSCCGSMKRMSINNGIYHCSLCDTDQTQQTLRLTLTPLSCRAQDNEIYGEYKKLQRRNKEKKRRGVLHLR